MKRNQLLRYSAWVLLFGIHTAKAQFINVPLYFGATNSIRNELGFILQGTAGNPGDLVQLLRADFGIYPPTPDGSPHAFNPILAQTRIGAGTDPAAGAIGKFASSVAINRYVVTPMFIRVFNRYTTTDASFYGDSQIYSNSITTYGVFIARVDTTYIPMDPDDWDRDHLSNSHEALEGTDPLRSDTDGDGYLDGEEYAAGTDPLDDASFLQMVDVFITPEGLANIIWNSVASKSYQLEYSTELPNGEVSFVPYGDVIEADGIQSWRTITNEDELANAIFRVRLVVP